MRKNIICIATLLLSLTLIGCGVSNGEMEKLYNAVLSTGDLQLNARANEYDSIDKASNGPVPGGTEYYTYTGENGEKYRFDYEQSDSADYSYRVTVYTEYPNLAGTANVGNDLGSPEKTITKVYKFNKSVRTNQMVLVDSYITEYKQRFDINDEASKYGISLFQISYNEVIIKFDNDYVDESIVNYINDYTSGNISNLDIVVGTNQGECKATKIITAKSDYLKADINIDGMPEWVSVGDTMAFCLY